MNDISRMKFSELKEELVKRNLSTDGLKADMVARLEHAVSREQSQNSYYSNENPYENSKSVKSYLTEDPYSMRPQAERANPAGYNNYQEEGARWNEADGRHHGQMDREYQNQSRDDYSRSREEHQPRSRDEQYQSRSRGDYGGRGHYSSDRRDRNHDRGDRRDRDRYHDRGDRRDRDYGDRRDRHRSKSPSHRRSPIEVTAGTVPLHERIRRVNNWDVPPPGCENISAMEAKSMGMFQKGPVGVSFGTNIRPNTMGVQVDYGNGVTAQMARQARRIYVGGIPYGIEDEKLRDFINRKMTENSYALLEGDCVSSIQINHEKNFAFVEFRTPDEATNAIKLNDSEFEGQQLKFRRPKDYTPLPGHLEAAVGHFSKILQMTLTQSAARVFIGDIPTYLQEDHVKEIASAFGPVKDFLLVLDVINECSKGYGFCEYEDVESACLAVKGMNNLEIGDRPLLVDFASPELLERLGINLISMTMPSLISTDLIVAGAQSASDNPTQVMLLLNFIDERDLKDDDEYNAIRQDVIEVCEKFGTVECVVIPRPVQGQLVPGVGKVFVEFKEKDQTKKAVEKLAGTAYAGRTVLTSFFMYEKYLSGDF